MLSPVSKQITALDELAKIVQQDLQDSTLYPPQGEEIQKRISEVSQEGVNLMGNLIYSLNAAQSILLPDTPRQLPISRTNPSQSPLTIGWRGVSCLSSTNLSIF